MENNVNVKDNLRPPTVKPEEPKKEEPVTKEQNKFFQFLFKIFNVFNFIGSIILVLLLYISAAIGILLHIIAKILLSIAYFLIGCKATALEHLKTSTTIEKNLEDIFK